MPISRIQKEKIIDRAIETHAHNVYGLPYLKAKVQSPAARNDFLSLYTILEDVVDGAVQAVEGERNG